MQAQKEQKNLYILGNKKMKRWNMLPKKQKRRNFNRKPKKKKRKESVKRREGKSVNEFKKLRTIKKHRRMISYFNTQSSTQTQEI